ncbi:hypothetical protein [Kitasatospora sp. MY 5-36]|uniref:hypothetical protein n=1 Tax=Kitasatospora sp. MY 5-36 TaxID=1678027 RepID=UPI00131BA75B|nr:hypothetical protein [Kitasatospora sp. MY 5-36]
MPLQLRPAGIGHGLVPRRCDAWTPPCPRRPKPAAESGRIPPTATTDRGRRPQRTYATTDLGATAEQITPTLCHRLLADDDLTRATRELSTAIAAMPRPTAVASHLATLAHRRT